jgi:Ca-activated chloride channel family protein
MSFERPLLLLLAISAPLWWWLRSAWLASENKRLREFVRPAMWGRVDISPPPPRTLSRIFWSLSMLLFAVAAAGPTWGGAQAVIPTGGDNIAIALDVSTSMGSEDETPSRMGRAVAEISRLMEEFEGVRFSLVLFSSQARLAVPGTLDRDFLMSRLPLDPWDESTLPAGTELGTLVDAMTASLPEEDLETRLGIVFSDGGFHDFAVERSVEAAREAGLTLVTVGLGGLDSVPLPDGQGGYRTIAGGDTIRTSLYREPLEELAERTGGFFVRLSETGDLPSLVGELLSGRRSAIAARVAGGSGGRRFHIFLTAGLALAFLALILETRGR